MFHLEDDACEVGAEDFGVGEFLAGVEVLLVVKSDAGAVGDAAAASSALAGAGFGDGFDEEALDAGAGIEAVDAGDTGVDDGPDIRDGEGGFGDVGGEDDAAFCGRGGKDGLLGVAGEAGEKGEDEGIRVAATFEEVRGVADFAFAGEEDEGIAEGFACGEPFGGAGDLVGHRFGGEVGRVEDVINGEGAAFDGDDGCTAEELGEGEGVEGGGGDDDFEVGAGGEEAVEVSEDEIDIEGALVGFVDDEGGVLEEARVATGFGEEDAVGHEFDGGGLGVGAVFEADLVSDLAAEIDLEFLGDAFGDGGGGDASGLGAADACGTGLGGRGRGGLKGDFGELGSFSGAGIAADDDDLVGEEGVPDGVAVLGDGEVLWVGDEHESGGENVQRSTFDVQL